jgi:hypothetical protein
MKPSARGSAHTTLLKIRLPETLRQQLLVDAAGKPFNRVIVERLQAGSLFSDMNLSPVGLPMHADLYGVAVKALTAQELRLARHYRDLNAAIRGLSKVAMMLAPGSTLLRSVGSRSAAHRFLEGARDKIRGALDISLDLQDVMADHAPTDPEAETVAVTLPRSSSPTSLAETVAAASPRSSSRASIFISYSTDTTNEVSGRSGRPPEERDPGDVVEVKIRLPEALRQQLAAEASRNKRTLTAEIRARLELSCALEIFKRTVGREIAEIVVAATEKLLSLRQWRMGLTKLDAVIDALETAQADLNPLSGFMRRVRSNSGAARELEDVRNQIHTALGAVHRLAAPAVEADPPTNLIALLGTGPSISGRSNSRRKP